MNNTHSGAVVVGYDGSPDAKRALSWAESFARTKHRPLRVLVATADTRLRQLTELDQDWERLRISDLEADARQSVAGLDLGDVDLVTVEAGPAPALIMGVDHSSVLVLGSRGHGRVADAFVGSVSQHVTRHAPCPVVVVRESSNPDAKRVVVGVDGSVGAEPALEFAFDFAGSFLAPLTAIHVLQSTSPGPPYASRFVSDWYTRAVSAVEPVVGESLAKYAEKFPDVEVTREVVAGTVGRVLSDASEQAALLVVGSRGRGAFTSLLLGSVGQSVLNHARCPVVVAR